MSFFKRKVANAATTSSTAKIATENVAVTTTKPVQIQPKFVNAHNFVSVSDMYVRYVEKFFESLLDEIIIKGSQVDLDKYLDIRNTNSYAVASGRNMGDGAYYCYNSTTPLTSGNWRSFIHEDWTKYRYWDCSYVDLEKFNHMSGESFYDLSIDINGMKLDLSERTGWSYSFLKRVAYICGLLILCKIARVEDKREVFAAYDYNWGNSISNFDMFKNQANGEISHTAHQLMHTDFNVRVCTREPATEFYMRPYVDNILTEMRKLANEIPFSYNEIRVTCKNGNILVRADGFRT